MDKEASVLEELKGIYSDISEWLKFLETKLAVSFSLWTALIIAALSNDFYWELEILMQAVIMIPLLIGAVLNLVAFIPFLNRNKYIKKLCHRKYAKYGDPNNVVFYQNIFVMTYASIDDMSKSIEMYREKLESVFERKIKGDLENSYIRQIVETATVATIKAFLFDILARYIFILVLIVLVGLIIA